MRAQLLVLLIAGGTVLVVFSVIVTVFLLNRDSSTATVPATLAKTAEVMDPFAASPVIVAPVIPQTSSTPETAAVVEPVSAIPPSPAIVVPETAPSVATAAPAPTGLNDPGTTAPSSASPLSAEPTAPPAATVPPAVAAAVEAIAPAADVRAQQYIDALRVTGIRASGDDSKVLMNDRVYRVNDIVDRNLGLKLIKVAPDSLLFSDPTGATYTKIF